MALVEKELFETYDKVQVAINRLKAFEPKEGYYLAFSGGKDSIVIKKLTELAGVKYDSHYNITGIDPPELVNFIKAHHPDVKREPVRKTMWRLIPEKLMPPTRLVRYCCEHLKERGGQGRFVITGIRWAESSKRKKRKMTEICFKNKNKRFIHPILDWSDHDVWEFIRGYNLPYCKLYDDGWKRIGCLGCPMSTNNKSDLERYPKFKRLYRRAFENMLIERKKRNLKTQWKSSDDVFKWWFGEKEKPDTDQSILFE